MSFAQKNLLLLALVGLGVFVAAVLTTEEFKDKDVDAPSVQPPIYNFGDRTVGESVQMQLQFKNAFRKPISITDVRQSCGCTDVVIDQSRTLMPRQGEPLQVVVSTVGRSGGVEGHVIFDWKSADGKYKGASRFDFLGNVSVPAKIFPSFYDFGNIDLNTKQQFSRTLEVKRGRAPVPWNNIHAVSSVLKTTIKPEDKDTFLVTVSFYPSEEPIGIFKDELSVELWNGNEPTAFKYKIPFSAQITSEVDVSPKSLYFGDSVVGEVKEGLINLHSLSNTIHIAAVESSQAGLLSICSADVKGMNAVLHYRWTARNCGNASGKIMVKLDQPVHHTLLIPFIGYVERK